VYIFVAVPSKCLFRIHVQCLVLYSFQLEKVYQRRNSPIRKLPETDFLSWTQKCKDKRHNLKSNYVKERRKSKEIIPGSGATLKGKWTYYGVMNFLEYYLQRRTMELFQRQQLILKFHSRIQMKLKPAILSHSKPKYDSWLENGRSFSQKESQQELNEEWKYRN